MSDKTRVVEAVVVLHWGTGPRFTKSWLQDELYVSRGVEVPLRSSDARCIATGCGLHGSEPAHFVTLEVDQFFRYPLQNHHVEELAYRFDLQFSVGG